MEVHVSRERISSWKDFLVRYLLVFAGIASAWAVDRWNEWRQHRRVAEQTGVTLREELKGNLAEVREARQFDADQVAHADVFLRDLTSALKSGAVGRETVDRLLGRWDGRLQESLPSIRRSAWEAAIAGQAVATLDPGELRKFAGAYAELRRIEGSGFGPRSDGGELQGRYAQWELERTLGQADLAELARIVVRWEGRMRYEMGLMQAVEQTLTAALVPAGAANTLQQAPDVGRANGSSAGGVGKANSP